MNILLTGASGFIGSHLLRRLHGEGHRIVACVRNPKSAKRNFAAADYIACDFACDTNERDWFPRLEGIDAVINTVGIIRETRRQRFTALHHVAPAALFRAAELCGVRKVVQISALGADEFAESAYHLSKRAADNVLSTLDLAWTILRPSIVYGTGAKSTAFFRALADLPITPLVGQGEQPVQPIHIDDLTDVIMQCLNGETLNGRRLDLVGPAPVTMRELLQKQRSWLGGGALRALSVPYGLSVRAAQLGGFFGSAPIDAQTVQMLQRGNTGDVETLRTACGFMPRSLDDALQATPSTEADRWHARLYFLAPALRLSIAALWIFTAIVSAFLYPADLSYALLAQVGIKGSGAPYVLYGAAALDFLMGLALVVRFHIGTVAMLQVLIIASYSLIISVALPEFWLHPYGPVSKNLPLIVATLIMLQLERR